MENDLLRQAYERYGREIYLYLYALCGNRTDAEDLTQDTFMKALLSLNNEHPNVRAWLYTVARNLFLDRARRASFESPMGDDPPPAETETPDEVLQKKQTNQRLMRALDKLDARKREVIVLQYFSGMSVKQIAAVTGLSQENVRVLAYRAKKDLKKYLEENENEI